MKQQQYLGQIESIFTLQTAIPLSLNPLWAVSSFPCLLTASPQWPLSIFGN